MENSNILSLLLKLSTPYIIISNILGIITLIGTFKMFKKADYPGWWSLIPILNLEVIFKIGNLPGWWAILLLFIQVENFISYIVAIILLLMLLVAYANISKSFNKNKLFALGLLFFPTIFICILGYDNSKYKKL